jgi:pimeloyl-ACP methyl ester carboxylesterase
MAHAIPGAELLVFEDAAHSAMLELPGPFNDAVARFLDGPRAIGGSAAAAAGP